MNPTYSSWPVCGRCCEVAWFPWLGGAHHCVVAEPAVAIPEDAASSADDLEWSFELIVEAAVEEVSTGLPARLEVAVVDDGGLLLLGEGLADDGPCVAAVVATQGLWARYDVESIRHTGVRVWPAPAVFGSTSADGAKLGRRAQELAFLHPGLTVQFADERTGKTATLHYPGGLVDYVKRINRIKTPIQSEIVHYRCELLGTRVEIALQWNACYSATLYAFVNLAAAKASTKGLQSAVANALSRYAKRHRLLRDTEPELDDADAAEGLAAVIAIRSTQPAAELNPLVEQMFGDYLLNWLEDHPADANTVVRKAISSADAARSPRRSHCGMV